VRWRNRDSHVAALLSSLLFRERAILFRWSGLGPAAHVCRNHGTRLHRLRRVLPRSWTVYPEPDYSCTATLWVGVDQLPAAADTQEDQRDSLPPITDSSSHVGRTICSGG